MRECFDTSHLTPLTPCSIGTPTQGPGLMTVGLPGVVVAAGVESGGGVTVEGGGGWRETVN